MPNRLIDGRDKPLRRTGLHKPVIGILSTITLASTLYLDGERSWENQLAALIIAVSFTVGAVIVGIFTEDWTWRAVGVLIALIGTAGVYWWLLSVMRGYADPNPMLTQAVLRSSLSVGGILLFLGILQWGRERRTGRRLGAFEFIDTRNNYRKP